MGSDAELRSQGNEGDADYEIPSTAPWWLQRFEAVCAVVIVANTITMGVQSDFDMLEATGSDEKSAKNTLRVLEICFLSFYTIEIIVKLFILQTEFFRGPDWRWN